MANMMLNNEDTTTNFSLLALSGKDGRRFLQGQLSCDMDQLQDGQILPGALCNLKGRVVASMRVWQCNDVIYLCAGQGMADIIANTLNKYMVFFDCQLSIVTEQYQLWRMADAASSDAAKALATNTILNDDSNFAVCLDKTDRLGTRYELFVAGESNASALMAQLPDTLEPASPEHWAVASTESAWVMIRPEISEKYTPQLLNYDLNGTVNFKKGCYTGQEVIARMYYRAEAKQRLYRLQRPSNSEVSDFGINKADNIVFTAEDGERVVQLVIASTDDTRRHPDIETITN
ncbi:tRNA-modifying protein YgfZ [Pseudohongiella nitratireducens]|uniref:tRNA-modifying protein YgfZ n=2 Tax=Pseudohongiella nitratireducens TaxID=1768907 RepID=A0A917GKA9_9GAMM|nr:tRNA-modifying protein YgfZ [Pseudohongiella nitratireducens]